MLTPRRTALEVLVGFEMGLYSRDDVREWVNDEIERRDVLPAALLDLTVLRTKHDLDIAALLRALSPETPPDARARMELRVLGALVRSGRVTAARAARWAPSIASELSASEHAEAYGLVDLYELAEEGAHVTLAEAEREFLAFLGRYG